MIRPLLASLKTTIAALLACFAILLIPCAFGQTLTLANDSQTFATLPATTVTLTGRSELRITGTTAPITGSVIHLNSPDSWFFMTNIRPSVVNSTYLGQIRVNGAAAVLNTNCRIVQYADGTVVIPHSPTFAPLQVFSGGHFTGTSLSLQNHTAYNDASLGALANNISSFKLKRGYMATIAQNANGTGVSKNYVAADGDIEVSVLPGDLDDSVSFVRIFPWRWVGKKGSCDVAPETLDARWHYNWDNNRTSTLDWEYVPIKQQRWWPAYPNGKVGSTHVLGYNEPNNSVEDSYESLNGGLVDNAIAAWPELLESGLRLGSPAVTDGGEAWLYDFMAKADAAKLRVDFVAIHFYRCGYTAQGLYDWLYNIHLRTGRKLWVTEFNNGANWTTCADPTLAQNATTLASFIEMMDNAPFIERYAVYSNVEDVRKVVDSSNALTPAGQNYQANASPIAYSQEIPEVPTAPVAVYRFENNALDSSPYGHPAILKGQAKFTTGNTGRAVALSGVAADGDCVQLSNRLGESTDFTFGAWIYWTGGANWQRVFDLGSGTNSYMFLSPAAGDSGNLRFAIKDGGAEQQLNHNAPLPLNTWTHVAVTLSGNTGKLFINGAVVATNTAITINPVDLETSSNYLGKSQFADPLFAGRLDDVEFLNYALTDANVPKMLVNTAPVFANTVLAGGNATQGVAYNGSVVGTATDADAGDTLTYSKGEGAAWLNVSADGVLTGTPAFNDGGIQQFTVYATDSGGLSAFALLTIQLPSISGNGTWTADADGNWSEVAKWTGNFPANGPGTTANFSTLNITSDRTVTLDASRSIGTLQFGDTSGTQNWTLAAAPGHNLTLDAVAPTIAVNQNTATITALIQGTAGFTKSGAGTLVLKGDNPLTGTMNIDVASNTENSGAVRLAGPKSASGLTGIQIRNNNAGSSTLELDGSSGAITVAAAAPINLSGRGGSLAAIRNIGGSNTLAGALTLQSGGGNYYLQADSGTLNLSGALTSNAPTTTRSLTFQGAGDFNLTGVVSNGTTTAGVGIVKGGTGALNLGATNTFTGDITIQGGTITASAGQGSTPAASNLGALQPTANRNFIINTGATLSLTGGNVLGTGGSSNTLSNNTLIVNAGGVFMSGLNGVGTGWWNKIGAVNLNGGTIRIGSGANATSYQGLALIGTVTVGGNAASTVENHPASNNTSNGVHLGQNAPAGQIVTFNVADATASPATDLTVSAKLLNTSANLTASGLLKTGTGTLTLAGANAYTGTTTVSGGTLLIDGSTAASPVTVATAATLGGSGTIGSSVTVQSGGTMAPGNSVGKLTVNGAITLQAGSTTRMEINKTAATRDVLAATGTLSYGGTLVVTNLAGTLAAGDSFILFQAGTINGSFSTVTLPTLGAGLVWDTTGLPAGTLSISAPPSNYAGWAGGFTFPPGTGGPADDADGDGMDNAFEWLFGSNPLAADLSYLPQSAVRSLTAVEYPAADSAKHYLTLTAVVRKSHSGMTLVCQVHSNPDQLDTGGTVTSFLVQDLGDFEKRTWFDPQAVEDSPQGRGFMRLKRIGE